MDRAVDAVDPGVPRGPAWFGAALRAAVAVLGAFTLVGGLTWLLLNLQGPHPVVDLMVGAVLAAGGLVLLMPHRIRLPRFIGVAGAALAALVGTGAGLLSGSAELCCMYAYVATRGFPFQWVQRGASAETPETARSLALAADWQIDLVAVAVNLLFWGYAGLLTVVALALATRARRRSPAPPIGS